MKLMNFIAIETSLHARRLLQKTVLVMRLMLILLIVGCFQLSAKDFRQKANISGKVISLKKGFTMIKKQPGYTFFYDCAIWDAKERACLFLFILINSLTDPNPQLIRSNGSNSQVFMRISTRIPIGKLLIILTRLEIIAKKIWLKLPLVKALFIVANHLFSNNTIISQLGDVFGIAEVIIWALIKLILFFKGK